MNTPETKTPDIPPDVMADMEEVCRQAEKGIVRDPELLKRIYERSAKVREDALRRFGVQDIGVPIIRQMRERA
jgi:hypothetical protein